MQLGAGGGVLQVNLALVRIDDGGRGKGGQRAFVKAAEDQLFLAGVGVDVAHGKDAAHAGGKFFGVHHQLFALDLQVPFGNRAQLGAEAKEDQQRVQRHHARHAVAARHLGGDQLAIALLITRDLADHELHLLLLAQGVHARHAGRRRAKAVAAVQQDHAGGLVGALGRKVERPVQGRVAAAGNQEVLAGKGGWVAHAVKELFALEGGQPVQLDRARLERAHAGGDEHGARDEARAGAGGDLEAPVVQLAQHGHRLAQVEGGAERLDLLEQGIGQLLPGAHRNGGDVVDRLVGVQLDRLAAGHSQRVDHVRLDLQQAQLEHLEQPHRAGADDEGVGLDRAAVAVGGVDDGGVGLGFHGCSLRMGLRLWGGRFSAAVRAAFRRGLSSRRHRAARPCAG